MKQMSARTGENVFLEIMRRIYSLLFSKNEINTGAISKSAKLKNNFYFFGDYTVYPEINSIQWDEYGNPYVYEGKE
jgi:hypothetical protein